MPTCGGGCDEESNSWISPHTHAWMLYTMTPSSTHYIHILYFVYIVTPYNVPDFHRFLGRGGIRRRRGYQILTAWAPHKHTNMFCVHYDPSSTHYIHILYLVCIITPYNVPDADRFLGRVGIRRRRWQRRLMAGATHIYARILCVHCDTLQYPQYNIHMLCLVCIMTPYNIPDVDRFLGRVGIRRRRGYQLLTAGASYIHTNVFCVLYDPSITH